MAKETAGVNEDVTGISLILSFCSKGPDRRCKSERLLIWEQFAACISSIFAFVSLGLAKQNLLLRHHLILVLFDSCSGIVFRLSSSISFPFEGFMCGLTLKYCSNL